MLTKDNLPKKIKRAKHLANIFWRLLKEKNFKLKPNDIKKAYAQAKILKELLK